MSMKTTANQRHDVSVTGDAIWRHYIVSEERQTKQWNQNFSYLMRDENKIDVDALIREDQKRLKQSQKNRKQAKPFFSELSMLPEEPHRRDASSRSRFLYQQDKNRKIPKSKRVRDQEIKLSVPPHMHDPSNPKLSSKRFNGPRRQVESHSSFSSRSSSSEVESIIARFRNAEQRTKENASLQQNVSPRKQQSSPHKSSLVSNLNATSRQKRPRMGEEYFELDTRLPQQKFQAPQTQTQEIGWDPRSLEIFGVASHGLKKTDLGTK